MTTLSPRQYDVARLIAEGLSSKTIAVRLGIQTGTVQTHVQRIFDRLKVNSRAQIGYLVGVQDGRGVVIGGDGD